jgi:FSR family fosmidomycin resistance protein-like MFS transporter
VSTSSAARDLDRRGLAALAAGHAAADLCQGSVPALIPFLISQRGYSYGAAGALLLAVTVGSSIIQPLFGAVSDRLSLSWLMPVGVALAAVGIAGAGVTHSFVLTAGAVWASPHSTQRAPATPTTPRERRAGGRA